MPHQHTRAFVRGRFVARYYTALFRVRCNAADVVAMAFEKLWILNFRWLVKFQLSFGITKIITRITFQLRTVLL
jgi:hypothetical protein